MTVVPSGSVLCILCRGAVNLKSRDLSKFKTHLETIHDASYDLDLLISLAFLDSGEKEGIVESMFPRIREFFRSIKHSSSNYAVEKLDIEKRLQDDDDDDLERSLHVTKKMRVDPPIKNVKEVDIETISDDGQDVSPIEEVDRSSTQDASDESDIEERRDEARCDLCQYSFPLENFLAHMEQHKREYSQSKESGTGTINSQLRQESREIEERKPTTTNPDVTKCDVCGKEMKKQNMSRHRRRVHGLTSSYNMLSRNNFSSNNATSDSSSHNNSLEVQCEDSKPQEKTNSEPKHVQPHLAIVRCEICSKLMQKKSMTRHMASVHPLERIKMNNSPPASSETLADASSGDQDFRCRICFDRFHLLNDVKDHVKDVHDIDYEDLEAMGDMKGIPDDVPKKPETLSHDDEADETLNEKWDDSD